MLYCDDSKTLKGWVGPVVHSRNKVRKRNKNDVYKLADTVYEWSNCFSCACSQTASVHVRSDKARSKRSCELQCVTLHCYRMFAVATYVKCIATATPLPVRACDGTLLQSKYSPL
jgi:hypothetical protein